MDLTTQHDMIVKAVPQNATIGVIAPAGPSPAAKVDAIAPWLAAQGLRAKIFPGCRLPAADFSAQSATYSATYLAGDDAVRLADLHAAFADPEVDAVICMRGGYGSARLLDGIDFDLIRRHAKPFFGYSDITALHGAFSQRAGMTTIHAPMLASDLIADDDGRSTAALLKVLSEGWKTGDALMSGGAELATWVPGSAQGTLVGGNLAVVCSLMGTPWAIDVKDAIVFIEDIGEDPYRVDRLLTQMRLAGDLDAAAGFLIGSFSDADDPSEMIAAMLKPYGKPILAGWPAGHCSPNYPLPIGARVLMDATAQRIALL